MAGNANSAGKRRRPIRRPLRTPRDRMRAIWPLLRPSNVSLSRRQLQALPPVATFALYPFRPDHDLPAGNGT